MARDGRTYGVARRGHDLGGHRVGPRGRTAVSSMTPALNFKQFCKYEIIRKVGRSMTDVYLALGPETNRRVVLKIVEHSHDAYTKLVMEAEKRGAMIQKQLHALDPRILARSEEHT